MIAMIYRMHHGAEPALYDSLMRHTHSMPIWLGLCDSPVYSLPVAVARPPAQLVVVVSFSRSSSVVCACAHRDIHIPRHRGSRLLACSFCLQSVALPATACSCLTAASTRLALICLSTVSFSLPVVLSTALRCCCDASHHYSLPSSSSSFLPSVLLLFCKNARRRLSGTFRA